MADLGPRKFEGIGPTTKDGMPIVLRSEVKENNQAKWYKRMYDTIHKSPNDDFVTVRYKTRRVLWPPAGRYPHYSSCSRPGSSLGRSVAGAEQRGQANGYASEPEPALGYDSDYYEDRGGAGFRSSSRTDSRYEQSVYKNQPGRIEDYTPGCSSLAERETKQHLEQQKYATTTNSKSYGHLSRALQEQGYESDSQLLRRRNGEMSSPAAPLSPPQQREAYRNLQAGGDAPIQGFRKPAPERPKDPEVPPPPPPKGQPIGGQYRPESPYRYVDGEVTIHYRSPVRREALDAWSEEELARRQAEAMRIRHKEERRRKYLLELQDMNNRRHADNFTPDQKSPIPLNRFDDFVGAEPTITNELKNRPERRIVARALYNFQGQSARELSFRKGDLIYVRRQLDRNWYEGEHNAAVGMFPYNYVEILPHDGIRQVQRKPVEGQARAKFNFIAQTNLELSLLKGELVTLTRRVDENWFEGRINNKRGIFPVSYVEVLADIGSASSLPALDTAKPVASPAAHSLMTNGARHQSMGAHHYVPPPCPGIGHLAGSTGNVKTTRPTSIENTLTVDTHTEPVAYRALYKYKPQNSDELELAEGDIVYVLEKCDDGWYVGSSQRTGCFGTFPGNYVEKN
ncbi:sorbin and SH3 domain-containing protein 1 isoform X3 [Ctenocephalides felis]|uniref:sorbin and SH3 domain-containing protein 1 isoform X3 n=1 Tax=Ctenocephalides felis TaxID=7515 RepID=UPI000E6E31A3|nr:sorbin and SH3 domain-containing protein 1 isoform X3 [Ctenocephalides felis]